MITAFPEVTNDSISNDCNFIILACDGIWDCMTNQEACDFVFYIFIKLNFLFIL